LKLEDHKNRLHIKEDIIFCIVSKKNWWIMFSLGWHVSHSYFLLS
jgi:hypothetical protein